MCPGRGEVGGDARVKGVPGVREPPGVAWGSLGSGERQGSWLCWKPPCCPHGWAQPLVHPGLCPPLLPYPPPAPPRVCLLSVTGSKESCLEQRAVRGLILPLPRGPG